MKRRTDDDLELLAGPRCAQDALDDGLPDEVLNGPVV